MLDATHVKYRFVIILFFYTGNKVNYFSKFKGKSTAMQSLEKMAVKLLFINDSTTFY